MAVDKSPSRLARLREALSRLHLLSWKFVPLLIAFAGLFFWLRLEAPWLGPKLPPSLRFIAHPRTLEYFVVFLLLGWTLFSVLGAWLRKERSASMYVKTGSEKVVVAGKELPEEAMEKLSKLRRKAKWSLRARGKKEEERILSPYVKSSPPEPTDRGQSQRAEALPEAAEKHTTLKTA